MYAIQMKNIVKTFGHTIANKDITLEVEQGDIFAIIGENGAGKTTLMNVLFGLFHPDSGTVSIMDNIVDFHSPKEAISAGLGMVHQHFKLVPSLTVVENIFLGYEITQWGFISLSKQVDKVKELSKEFGLEIDPLAIVADLSVGLQQRVEILKVLLRGVKILILDEPTAVLTPQETWDLFLALQKLNKEKGITIIFISHHIDEILQFSNRLLVLRNGTSIAVKNTEDVTAQEIAELIIGASYTKTQNTNKQVAGKAILQLNDIYHRKSNGILSLDNISFSVNEGEIVGIAGIAGNGQEELIKIIAGIESPSYGKLFLNGKDITGKDSHTIRSMGLAHVPGDRMHAGINPEESIYFNLMLGKENLPAYCQKGILNYTAFENDSNQWINNYNVKCFSGKSKITELSGGNIQKVVVAREFTHESNLLLIDQPTQGIDIGSSNFIYQEILNKRQKNIGILLFSFQLDELLSLCDRIYVMFEGRIMGEVFPDTTTEQEIGLLMTGTTKGEVI